MSSLTTAGKELDSIIHEIFSDPVFCLEIKQIRRLKQWRKHKAKWTLCPNMKEQNLNEM